MHSIFLLYVVIILFAYVLKRLRILHEDHGKSLARVILHVTLPAVILKTITYIALDISLSLLPIICIVFSAALGISALRIFKNSPEKGLSLMSVVGFNIGIFAYPLIEGLFGNDGLIAAAMFDFGNAFVVFGLSYFFGFLYSPQRTHTKIHGKDIFLLFAKSIPFMSYIVAISMNISGLQFPLFVFDMLDVLARANMALVLLVLGLTLNFTFKKSSWIVIMKIMIMRYASSLIVGTLLYHVLPLPKLYKTIVFIGLNLPVALSVIPFAVEFGYDEDVAGTTVNIAILISFLLLWVLLGLHII